MINSFRRTFAIAAVSATGHFFSVIFVSTFTANFAHMYYSHDHADAHACFLASVRVSTQYIQHHKYACACAYASVFFFSLVFRVVLEEPPPAPAPAPAHTPTSSLFDLVVLRRWAEAKARVESHPSEARVEIEGHGTALHEACWRGAPPQLVDLLLRAFPEGASLVIAPTPDDVYSYAFGGDTPFHLAIKHAHISSAWDWSVEVMRLLIRADRAALSTPNGKGLTPSNLLCTCSLKELTRQRDKGKIDGGSDISSRTNGSYNDKTARIWNAVFFLAGESAAAVWRQAAGFSAGDLSAPYRLVPMPLLARDIIITPNEATRTWQVLQNRYAVLYKAANLHCRKGIPRYIIESIADCHYPDLLRPWDEADEDGNLALHRFLINATATANRNGMFSYNEDFERFIGCMLLSMRPQAAEVTNRAGRLPLHLAAAVCGRGGSNAGGSVGLLGDIFMAFPNALRACDPVTGLLPFMLPAVGRVDDTVSNDDCDLNAIYMLLQADPEGVRSGIKGESRLDVERKNLEHKKEVSILEHRLFQLDEEKAKLWDDDCVL